MSVPVPLGVRLYQVATGLDQWVTRWVDDISFRSVIPGGFASANITLHNQAADAFTRLAKLFVRVQIVDLRSQEIAWEGRVDTARRSSDSDTWELGCLGSMVCATDIQRPMFYIDGDVDSWVPHGTTSSDFRKNKIPEKNQLESVFADTSVYAPSAMISSWDWQRAEETDLFVGRFDATYAGAGSHPNLSRLATGMDVTNGNGAALQSNVDLTTLTTAAIRKANPVGGASSFTSTTAQRVLITVGNSSATGTTVTEGQATSWVADPRIQVQRVDRNGTKLTAAADYPTDYLTVAQIVEDVVGRFLVSAWNTRTGNNIPYSGQVRPDDLYIDSSSTAQITNLTYYDGATAADILGDLMAAQTDAYWAIWESSYGTQPGSTAPGFRFEWAAWPAGWGYQASSIDGLEEQPDGAGIYNYLYYKYPTNSAWSSQAGYRFVENYWDENNNQLLSDAQLTRGLVIQREEPTDSTTAFNAAAAKIAEYRRTLNTGTLTVKRPIHLYDPGSNSNSGASRMLDPWLIRPGKLIRITDMSPRGMSNDLRPTPTVPNPALDGTVFRVVSTEYSSGDNSCRLELDTVPGWELANQVAKTKPSGKLVARG